MGANGDTVSITTTLEKLCKKFDYFENKLNSVESKIDARLNVVEEKCSTLLKKCENNEIKHHFAIKEIHKLKATINQLEQKTLENNIIIKGINEKENNPVELSSLVLRVLRHVVAEIKEQDIVETRRISRATNKKPILVVIKDSATKLKIMKNLKDKQMNCAMFVDDKINWGAASDLIYLSDHLTRANADIFYHTRKLKKQGKIKYTWTKFGHVYAKEDDVYQAYRISSMEIVTAFEKELTAGNATDTETDVGGMTDLDGETKTSKKRGKPDSSPSMVRDRPKRIKAQAHRKQC